VLEVKLSGNLAKVRKEIADARTTRIPTITRNAINDSAVIARDAEKQRIRAAFDRPVRFTVNAPVFPAHLRATTQHQEATIMVRDEARGGTAPSVYLKPEIEGGPRPLKPFERILRNAGILRSGEFAVPARGVTLNAYGNISGNVIQNILSQLKAFGEVGFLANETPRSRKRAGKRRAVRYFMPRQGTATSLPRGIYERRGRAIKAVLIFVRQAPRYQARYAFGIAGATAARDAFPNLWANGYRKAYPLT
jgi:hypothetical protein